MNEKKIIVEKVLKRRMNEKEIILQYLNGTHNDRSAISEIFTNLCFEVADPDNISCIFEFAGIERYDWKAACCKMQKALCENDNDTINELLSDAVKKLDSKMRHEIAFLETGSFYVDCKADI